VRGFGNIGKSIQPVNRTSAVGKQSPGLEKNLVISSFPGARSGRGAAQLKESFLEKSSV
jgi:hypothetical protein